MKLETFFEKFDQFADASDAVAKMRKLVLHLAVTGKLVPQDPNDEPSDKLIERVSAALPDKKSENPFLGEIEASITDESEYELPSGWAWLPLGHAGIWATGCGFPTQYQGEADREFLFCKVSDMNLPGNEVEIHTTVHTIDAEVMKKIRARANPAGTVIFPKIGGAIATHKRRLVIKPTIIDNNCSGIQPIGITDNRWLLLFMRSLDLTKYQSGTSVPAVSQGSLDPIRIGLPPLAEQKRIVAKADELMALCARLEAQQQERETRHAALARASLARFAAAPTPANLHFLFHPSYDILPVELRKSILSLAVQGKLVPQDPKDEPAVTFSESESLFDIPTSWRWQFLGNLGLCRTGKTPPTSDPTNYGVGFPFIGPGQITASGRFTTPEKTITSKGLENSTEANASDILMVCIGGSIGKAAICREPLGFNQQINSVRLKRDLPEFVFLAVMADYFQEKVLANASGSATPIINKGKWESLPIPIPPLGEQRRIVSKVEQLMALVDELETQLAAARASVAKLLDTLVAGLTAGKEPHAAA